MESLPQEMVSNSDLAEGTVSVLDYSMLQPNYGEEISRALDLKMAKLEQMILALR